MGRMRTIVVGMLLASSLLLSGCKKKKPPLPPPQAQAPTITDSTGVPSAIPEVTLPQPSPKPQPPKPGPAATRPKKRPRVSGRSDAKKTPPPATQSPAPQTPAEKVVIEEGGKQDPAPPLVADTSDDQAARQRLSTAQLISSTEYDIRAIARPLSADEQAIVQHIRGFIEQSRQATRDGDTERAHNLAVKAHLLSDSIAKK